MALDLEKLSFPDEPGVYLMKDKKEKIIYIGKANSLSKRIKSHFQNKEDFIKKEYLIPLVDKIEYIITRDKIESLILEANLIKKHQPRFNIKLKDDKSYPYIKIDLNKAYPRMVVTRKRLDDQAEYFGPYPYVKGLRKTLQIIKELFPLRLCHKINQVKKKPCLNYDIKFCLAPCADLISQDNYYQIAHQACEFLRGEKSELLDKLKIQMKNFSKELKFEEAAKLRDKITLIEGILKHQETVISKEDIDVIALSFSRTLAIVVILLIRGKRISDQRTFLLDNVKYLRISESQLLANFLKQYYLNKDFIPSEIILPYKVEDQEILEAWLKDIAKRKVKIATPNHEKKRLLDLALLNADAILAQKETGSVLMQLKDLLKLEKLPIYIEGFDISNLSRENAVGSCVVFKEGRPVKKEYRKFKIKTIKTQDDFAMLGEIVERRCQRLLKENKDLPNLMVVDGGKGQQNFVKKALEGIGITEIEVAAIAKERPRLKKEDRIFLPHEREDVTLPKNSPALRLIQNIRNEAHRFAISYHKKLRSKEMVKNDQVITH
ncbi:excinuclease ABC subunit UvrC [bacterium]|nr:excinuclease ABC subunit UvrC [bacterium]MBU2599560.1 excinuclease ABC subunit UvrC [bacterium]